MLDIVRVAIIFGVVTLVVIAIVWLTFRCFRKGKPLSCKGRLDGKVVVVTGGDTPVGIHLIR